jgi:hypothetical protein
MGVREDCRHYSTRSTPGGDVVQRCRLGANEDAPFACPQGCVFFEPRSLTDIGWTRDPDDDEDDPGLYGDA